MGIAELFGDLLASTFSTPEMCAASPAAEDDDSGETPSDEGDEGKEGDEGSDDSEGGQDNEDDHEEGEDEEEEEEEEEPEDLKPKLEEECANSEGCRPLKHHYDSCVERVEAFERGESKGPKEDCVEEFFHLMHCATTCAAPKLWASLR